MSVDKCFDFELALMILGVFADYGVGITMYICGRGKGKKKAIQIN